MKIFTACQISFLLIITGIFLFTNKAKAQAPTAPINLTAVSETSSRIRLNWQDQSSNETRFIIERAQNTDDNFVPIDSVGTDTTEYLDLDLTAETTYFYRVKASNTSGESAYSNTIGASTVPVTSINDPNLNKHIRIYPIPTQAYLTIEANLNSTGFLTYTMLNLQGRVLQTDSFKNQFILDLNSLPKGLYFLVIQVGKNRLIRKVLKH